MIAQLELHDREKGSTDNISDEGLHTLVIDELEKRLHVIRLTSSVDVAKLQSVHMANYLFIWFNRLAKK